MSDQRKRSQAKKARREARRDKSRGDRESHDEAPLIDEVREALDHGQPLDLLGLASMVIQVTDPQLPAPDDDEFLGLDELVGAFIGTPVLETTALLAVFGELLVDDDVLRDRCRRTVDARNDRLPGWLADLPQTVVIRAVRMTDAFGDSEELLLGVRLADGQHLTCAVNIDHLMMSEVRDAFFVPEPIDRVITIGEASNTDPDTRFLDVDLAEARAKLEFALEQYLTSVPPDESDTWPSCYALVRWLTTLMPAGESIVKVQQRLSEQSSGLSHRFFGSLVGMAFDDAGHRELLAQCIASSTGDPLRWSTERLRQLLDGAVAFEGDVTLDVQLMLPELLLAFVPFAHAEAGIRQELTAEALAVIAEQADDYREMVSDEAEYWQSDDD